MTFKGHNNVEYNELRDSTTTRNEDNINFFLNCLEENTKLDTCLE